MIPSYKIAVLMPVEPEYSSRLLEGAIAYAMEHPEITLIEMLFVRVLHQGKSPLPEGPPGFDGALLWLNPHDTWVEHLLDEEVVVVNAGGEWKNKVPIVGFKGLDVEELAVEHLFSLGRKHLAYIGVETTGNVELTRRQESFLEKALQRGMHGKAFETGLHGAIENRMLSLPENVALALRRFLSELGKPAAIWCEDDYVARLVCVHAAAEGLRVPEDLAVLGLGDYSVARLGNPPISTIAQPGELVGHRAVEMIHRVLSGKIPAAHDHTIPPPPVVVRESTGGGVPADKRFQLVHQWIQDHACDGLSVNDLVNSLPMSRVTFNKQFSKLYGCTPGQEIRRVKTENAKRYLRATKLTIDRIAELCGFEQQGKFSKFFKRQVGVTPSDYRNST